MKVIIRRIVIRMNRLASAAKMRIMRTHPVSHVVGREPLRISLVPILAVTGWWAISLAIWAFGYPIPYVRGNLWPVVGLVVSCIVATTFAFVYLSRRLAGDVEPSPQARRLPLPVTVGVVAIAVLLIPWAEYYSGYHLWEIGAAIADQGAAFTAAAARVEDGTASRLGIVLAQTVLAPVTITVVPVTAFAWFEHRRHFAPLLVGLAALASMSLLVGRAYYLITAAVLVLGALLVSRVRRRLAPSWRTIALSTAAPILFVVVFALSKRARGGDLVPLCPPGVARCTATKVPTLWESVSTYVASYSSQSMEGLGRAMQGEWAFGGGYRHSAALTGIAQNLGIGNNRVITDQLEDNGWSDTAYWSTGWAWLANDVPWIAVPFVMAAWAALLALAWRRAVRDGEWMAVALFCYTWMVLLLFAQNNMLAADGPAYMGYIALAVAFLGREARRSWGQQRMAGPAPGV